MNRVLILCLVFVKFAFGADFDDVKNGVITMNENAAASQNKIDKLDDETRKNLSEFRSLDSKLKTLQAYEKQLEFQVQSQEKEIKSLENQILSLEETKQIVFPLTEKMASAFGELVQKDIPFLSDERQKRAESLKQMLEFSDISLSEKYRRIIEAYKIEYDFTNTIEAYQGDLSVGGEVLKVDFLRVGRMGLYYLSLDEQKAGYYDVAEKGFKTLDKQYLKNIKQAVKVAKKHSAPNVLILPINTQRIN